MRLSHDVGLFIPRHLGALVRKGGRHLGMVVGGRRIRTSLSSWLMLNQLNDSTSNASTDMPMLVSPSDNEEQKIVGFVVLSRVPLRGATVGTWCLGNVVGSIR